MTTKIIWIFDPFICILDPAVVHPAILFLAHAQPVTKAYSRLKGQSVAKPVLEVVACAAGRVLLLAYGSVSFVIDFSIL